MSQWVQHISGQGRTFKVLQDSGFCWKAHLSDLEQDCWIPKSEYILCEPPEKMVVCTRDEVTIVKENKALSGGLFTVSVTTGKYEFCWTGTLRDGFFWAWSEKDPDALVIVRKETLIKENICDL
jgi:hypothetical protein